MDDVGRHDVESRRRQHLAVHLDAPRRDQFLGVAARGNAGAGQPLGDALAWFLRSFGGTRTRLEAALRAIAAEIPLRPVGEVALGTIGEIAFGAIEALFAACAVGLHRPVAAWRKWLARTLTLFKRLALARRSLAERPVATWRPALANLTRLVFTLEGALALRGHRPVTARGVGFACAFALLEGLAFARWPLAERLVAARSAAVGCLGTVFARRIGLARAFVLLERLTLRAWSRTERLVATRRARALGLGAALAGSFPARRFLVVVVHFALLICAVARHGSRRTRKRGLEHFAARWNHPALHKCGSFKQIGKMPDPV